MMIKKALIVWVVVLLAAVPYATYYLLFEAPREQYTLLIVFILFWIFGYWALVSPLVVLVKFLKLKHAIGKIASREELIRLINDPETEEAAIDFIVQDNAVPRFMAKWAYHHIVMQLAAANKRTGSKPA